MTIEPFSLTLTQVPASLPINLPVEENPSQLPSMTETQKNARHNTHFWAQNTKSEI